ncbi:MAG: ROK family protein [Verrucomicrobiales bacterium]|nr:ROK family protein [Verrucomicrobiales bacterium]
MSTTNRFGAIESGGTKVICGWSDEHGNILEQCRIPTTTPLEVINEVISFFLSVSDSGSIRPDGVGIGTFGPVNLQKDSSHYGTILKTPKPGWEGANLVNPIRTLFPGTRVVIDTDVNAAALGEMRWGAAQDISDLVYFTIGTGIGCGVISNGNPLHGLVHPEVGHLRIPRSDEDRRSFKGICPFHDDCLEGIASGPAMQARWVEPASELPANHQAWDYEADALAWACVNMIVTVSPRRIIIGGGVSQARWLFPKIREKVVTRLNGYVDVPEITEQIEDFIVPPQLGQDAGLKGAIALVLP